MNCNDLFDNDIKYTDTELLICRTMELLIVLLPVLFSVLGIGFAAISLVLVTKWVDRYTIPYIINNLSFLTP